MLTVRYATLSDSDFVGQDGYVSTDILLRKIAAREVVIADGPGRPLGYARIEFLWSKLPYLTLIRVLPDHRNQGVGRALLQFLEVQLRSGGHRLLLSSSQSNEFAPQKWHVHMGFSECGRLSGLNDDGSDEVFFRKMLG